MINDEVIRPAKQDLTTGRKMNAKTLTSLARLALVGAILMAVLAIPTNVAKAAYSGPSVTITVTTAEHFRIRSAPNFDSNTTQILDKDATFSVVACYIGVWGLSQGDWCLINADGPLAYNANDRWAYVSQKYLSYSVADLRQLPRFSQNPDGMRILETIRSVQFGRGAPGNLDLWGGAKMISRSGFNWISWWQGNDAVQFQDVIELPGFTEDQITVTNAPSEDCVFTDGFKTVNYGRDIHELYGGDTYTVPVGATTIVAKSGHCLVSSTGTFNYVYVTRREFRKIEPGLMGWLDMAKVTWPYFGLFVLAVAAYLTRQKLAKGGKFVMALIRIGATVIIVVGFLGFGFADTVSADQPTPPPLPGIQKTSTTTPTPTLTGSETPTPTLIPSVTPTPVPSETPTATQPPTLTPTLTGSETPTPTATVTNTPPPSATFAPPIVDTPEIVVVPSDTPIPAATPAVTQINRYGLIQACLLIVLVFATIALIVILIRRLPRPKRPSWLHWPKIRMPKWGKEKTFTFTAPPPEEEKKEEKEGKGPFGSE